MPFDPDRKLEDICQAWQIAAIDLPVPEKLDDQKDGEEWSYYLELLPPASVLRKFAQALDQYNNAVMDKCAKKGRADEPENEMLDQKWEVAFYTARAAYTRFHFSVEDVWNRKEFKDKVDVALYFTIEFLKGANSSDLSLWEKRRYQYHLTPEHLRSPLVKEPRPGQDTQTLTVNL